ncbi:hypothetical protein BHE74_00033927 [Ensete ventricosum]|nr:hypothetical protein GW17_00001622 [Ensete ventricosum]RWW59155.1 hypothetical protein BHE74_00033927 [Ensete ventricosum]
MVSDHEIASCVEPLLRQSDPATASLAGVVRRIEAKLGFDLSHKVAAFIRDQIELLLGSSRPPAPSSQSQPLFHQQHPAAPHNPCMFLHHFPLQQQIAPPKPISSAAVATSSTFPSQHSPGIVFRLCLLPPWWRRTTSSSSSTRWRRRSLLPSGL